MSTAFHRKRQAWHQSQWINSHLHIELTHASNATVVAYLPVFLGPTLSGDFLKFFLEVEVIREGCWLIPRFEEEAMLAPRLLPKEPAFTLLKLCCGAPPKAIDWAAGLNQRLMAVTLPLDVG